jgi:acyl-CoA dehydrogenase
MTINVNPVPSLDNRINDIRARTAEIVNGEILPDEDRLRRRDDTGSALREAVKAKVKAAGLWAPHLPLEYGGMGLDFLAHAYMNEVLAYAVGGASLFGVVAPNSGNQSLLLRYGTEEQKQRWLVPLVEGTIESGFSMTEPERAGSTRARSPPRRCATATIG